MSSFINLRESFIDNVSHEPKSIYTPATPSQVIYMSPVVHDRIHKIEMRLNEIEEHITFLDRFRNEPFLKDTLLSPKSRTEWLFSWNETLKDLLKEKNVYSITIGMELDSSANMNQLNEANYKVELELFNKSWSYTLGDCLSRLYNSLPPTFYQSLYMTAKKHMKEPAYKNPRKLSLISLEDYFPMQAFHY